MKMLLRAGAVTLFTAGYAVLISLSFTGLLFSILITFYGGIKYHPRFAPFCYAICILGHIALALIFILNYRLKGKLRYKNLTWVLQTVVALAGAVPLIYIWEDLIRFLWNTF